jgi:hypothetical protein
MRLVSTMAKASPTLLRSSARRFSGKSDSGRRIRVHTAMAAAVRPMTTKTSCQGPRKRMIWPTAGMNIGTSRNTASTSDMMSDIALPLNRSRMDAKSATRTEAAATPCRTLSPSSTAKLGASGASSAVTT